MASELFDPNPMGTSATDNSFVPVDEEAANPDAGVLSTPQVLPKAKSYAVDDPDSFVRQHIKESQKSQSASPYAVDDPDAFVQAHIRGPQTGTQVASENGAVPTQPGFNERFAAAEGTQGYTPSDVVSRMFPIKSLTDVGGMARRYGWYLGTQPNKTIAMTAAGIPIAVGAGYMAPAAASAAAGGLATAAGTPLGQILTYLAGAEEIASQGSGIKALYKLFGGE